MSATIKQRTCIVTIESEQPGGEPRKIIVHRMAWSAQRQLLKSLAVIIPKILAPRVSAGAGESAPSLLAILAENLPAIVTSSNDLVSLLVIGSTGLSLEEFDKLDSLTAAEVIRQALAVNYDDELRTSIAAIVTKLAGLMAVPEAIQPLVNPAMA